MIDENEMTLAKLNEEDAMPAEIVSTPEDFEEMSLSVQKRNKEALANLKSRVMLSLDERKLGEAQKIIGGMENIGDIFSDPEIMAKVRKNIGTAMDMKFLSEAYAKLLDSQQKLMRMDSIDGQGTAAKLSLAVQFKSSTGQEVKTVIHTEG